MRTIILFLILGTAYADDECDLYYDNDEEFELCEGEQEHYEEFQRRVIEEPSIRAHLVRENFTVTTKTTEDFKN